jgi:hypothetical protein
MVHELHLPGKIVYIVGGWFVGITVAFGGLLVEPVDLKLLGLRDPFDLANVLGRLDELIGVVGSFESIWSFRFALETAHEETRHEDAKPHTGDYFSSFHM